MAAAFTLVIPLFCGLAAFMGGRIRKSSYFLLIRCAPDGGVRATLAASASVVLVAGSMSVFVVSGILIPWGSLGVPAGHPDFSRLLSSVSSLTAGGLVGFVFGLLVPWWWAPPIACIGSYVFGVAVLVLGGGVTSTLPVLSPLYVASLGPYFDLNVSLFALRTTWFAAAGVAAVGIAVLIVARSRRVAAIISASGSAILIVVGAGVICSPTGVSLDRASGSLHCAGSGPELCLLPAYEPERVTISTALGPVERQLTATPFHFERVEVTQRGVSRVVTPGTVELHVDDFAQGWEQRDLGELVQSILDSRQSGAACRVLGPDDPLGYVYGPPLVFVGWAIDSRETADAWEGGGAAYDKLISMPRADQIAWVAGNTRNLCSGKANLRALR
ncbi:hypothetical protein [Frondihabitans sp. PAMC 28766]|uniref:hypothetical protein n=1 Tax=Frondihabitans sp. PAMC 28766 TaxID=1795630 RepID=UPI00138F5C28|nr:hypothetical protein [Frondihabitans sp. PAMC 28766]